MVSAIKILSLKSGRLKYKSENPSSRTRLEKKPESNEDDIEHSKHEIREEKLCVDHAKSTESFVDGTPQQEPVIGAGGAPEAIRQIFEDGNQQFDNVCQLIHEENTPRIYFKIPDIRATQKCGAPVFSVLQCADISAGDLKVCSKFGLWDTMFARIVIECDGPMLLWTKQHDCISVSNINKAVAPQRSAAVYDYAILNSCMVKATFPIENVAMARDMLHRVKIAKTREIANIKELKKHGIIARSTKNPSKIREGLPEWVNYIPYKWYSASVRRSIQYLLMFYSLVSLLWALWQLYRHVDFIRTYLQPIVKFIEHYFSMLKSWFQWMDNLFTILSRYWWNYFKPILMLVVAAFSPLFQIFKPLKGVVNLIPYMFDPFLKLFNMLFLFVKPLFLPLKAAFCFIYQNIFAVVNYIVSHATQNPTIAHLVHRGSEFYVVRLIQEAFQGRLDPLRAQFIVIRDLIFKSARKIYYGLRFIITRFYFMIIFLKREREYSKEGLTTTQQTVIAKEQELQPSKPKTE